ncbi:MAG: serine/threonine protein kinase, partial [bacterium]|nr:serine/threonine protein kinase [bacterium]
PAGGPTEDQDRLFREVQICRKISHPNVVRVHDFGRFPGGIFVIMELLDGPGLDAVIRKEAPLPAARVKTVLTGIAGALAEAHHLKIIHRDLKPSNVLVTMHDDTPVPKVIDFGIAKATQAELTERTIFTRFQEFIGTPAYMSPEQAQMSGLDVDTRSDVYALGVLLY